MPTNQRIRSIPPLNPTVWAFSMGGLVRHPLILSYADLLRLPSVTLDVSVICTEGRSIETASYTGVPLSALFDLVEIDPNATSATVHGYDGYRAAQILPHLLREQALVAYAVNGEPLNHDQGFPARFVQLNRFGFKMPKWVTRVEVGDHLEFGTWDAHILPDKKRLFKMGSIVRAVKITDHETLPTGVIRLSGFAYTYYPPISSIDISVDEGEWTPVPFDGDPHHWQIDWTPPYPNGVFTLRARLSDAEDTGNFYPSRKYTIRT